MTEDYGLVLLRREPPPDPPTFRCVGCGHIIQPAAFRWSPHRDEKPPLCGSCARHWGKGFGYNAICSTNGDRRVMQRLSALVALITWEAKNGHAAKK